MGNLVIKKENVMKAYVDGCSDVKEVLKTLFPGEFNQYPFHCDIGRNDGVYFELKQGTGANVEYLYLVCYFKDNKGDSKYCCLLRINPDGSFLLLQVSDEQREFMPFLPFTRVNSVFTTTEE